MRTIENQPALKLDIHPIVRRDWVLETGQTFACVMFDLVSELVTNSLGGFRSSVYNSDVEKYVFKFESSYWSPNCAGHYLPCCWAATRSSTRARMASKSGGLDNP